MKRSATYLAAGLALAASLQAQAQSSPDFGLKMDAGFYLAAGIGKSRTNIDCFGPCDQTDRSWNVSAGYQFNRNFAAELGYVDLGETTTTAAFTTGNVTAITKAKALELLGVAMLPFTDRFSVYLKGGLYRSDAKSTSNGLGSGIGGGDANDTGFTFGAGLQYGITPNLGLRFEWQNYNDMQTGAVGFAKADYTVWRGGARWKF